MRKLRESVWSKFSNKGVSCFAVSQIFCWDMKQLKLQGNRAMSPLLKEKETPSICVFIRRLSWCFNLKMVIFWICFTYLQFPRFLESEWGFAAKALCLSGSRENLYYNTGIIAICCGFFYSKIISCVCFDKANSRLSVSCVKISMERQDSIVLFNFDFFFICNQQSVLTLAL